MIIYRLEFIRLDTQSTKKSALWKHCPTCNIVKNHGNSYDGLNFKSNLPTLPVRVGLYTSLLLVHVHVCCIQNIAVKIVTSTLYTKYEILFCFLSSNVVYGRKAQDIRICACPGRDRTNEENAEAKRRSSQPAATTVISQTTSVTPPPTPQVSEAPHTPPEEPTTSTGETSQGQIPKLTKKRCKCGVPCTIPKGKGCSIKQLAVSLLSLDEMLVHCRLLPAPTPSLPLPPDRLIFAVAVSYSCMHKVLLCHSGYYTPPIIIFCCLLFYAFVERDFDVKMRTLAIPKQSQ